MAKFLDLKRMRYIVEVARAEAITSASETLHISQPALTRNILEVEDELGVQLFHRLPRGVKLTEEGRHFVARAKRILEDVEDLASNVSEDMHKPTGKLRIGFTPAGYLASASNSLRMLAKKYPDVGIETQTGSPQSICPRLIHGEIDLVIGSSGYLESFKELSVNRLVAMEFTCLVRKGHPLAKEAHVTEEALFGYPVVIPASIEPVYSDIAKRYGNLGLPEFRPKYVTDDFELAMGFVRSTNAYYPLYAPEVLFPEFAKYYHLITDIVKSPQHHISLAHAQHRSKSAITQIFEEMLINELS